MWDLPGPGIKPMSPALAGGYLTMSHQGSPAFLNTFAKWQVPQFALRSSGAYISNLKIHCYTIKVASYCIFHILLEKYHDGKDLNYINELVVKTSRFKPAPVSKFPFLPDYLLRQILAVFFQGLTLTWTRGISHHSAMELHPSSGIDRLPQWFSSKESSCNVGYV